MNEHTNPKEKPHIVELVGLAGVGKTTLLSTLIESSPKIISVLHISKIRHLYYFIKHTLMFLPRYLLSYRKSRWFNASENRSMAYLACWLNQLGDPGFEKHLTLMFDHGPLFRLVSLREFGPAVTQSKIYIQWWEKMLEFWINKLDYVIWLDAEDDLLVDRIQIRSRHHSIKGKSDREKIEFLRRYRRGYQQIMKKISDKNSPRLLSFNTDNQSPEQISREVMTALKIK